MKSRHPLSFETSQSTTPSSTSLTISRRLRKIKMTALL